MDKPELKTGAAAGKNSPPKNEAALPTRRGKSKFTMKNYSTNNTKTVREKAALEVRR